MLAQQRGADPALLLLGGATGDEHGQRPTPPPPGGGGATPAAASTSSITTCSTAPASRPQGAGQCGATSPASTSSRRRASPSTAASPATNGASSSRHRSASSGRSAVSARRAPRPAAAASRRRWGSLPPASWRSASARFRCRWRSCSQVKPIPPSSCRQSWAQVTYPSRAKAAAAVTASSTPSSPSPSPPAPSPSSRRPEGTVHGQHGVPGHRGHLVHPHGHVGGPVLDRLELPDRTPELHPHLGVLRGRLEAPPGPAGVLGRHQCDGDVTAPGATACRRAAVRAAPRRRPPPAGRPGGWRRRWGAAAARTGPSASTSSRHQTTSPSAVAAGHQRHPGRPRPSTGRSVPDTASDPSAPGPRTVEPVRPPGTPPPGRPVDQPREHVGRPRARAGRGEHSAETTTVGSSGPGVDRPARLLQEHRQLEQPEPLTAVGLGQVDAPASPRRPSPATPAGAPRPRRRAGPAPPRAGCGWPSNRVTERRSSSCSSVSGDRHRPLPRPRRRARAGVGDLDGDGPGRAARRRPPGAVSRVSARSGRPVPTAPRRRARRSPAPSRRSCPTRCTGRGRRRRGRRSRRAPPRSGRGAQGRGARSSPGHYRRGRVPAVGRRGSLPPAGARGASAEEVRAMTETATRRAHPHDPLTADEVRLAVDSVTGSGRVPDGTLFATVAVDEPDRAELAAFAAGRPGRPPDPAGGPPRARGGGRRGRGPHARRRRRRVDRARRRAPGPALRRRLPVHPRPQGRPRLAGGHGAPGHHRLRPGPDRPVAHRQLRQPDSRRAGGSPAASPTTARSRPTTATPDPSRACWPPSTRHGARSSRWSTTVWSPCPRVGAATCPRTTSRAATDLRPLDIVQPDGVSFTLDGNL